MPEVTVIIPMFNAQDFISQTIESVLRQTFQDWEMFVIDDLSTDKSKDIVTDFMRKDNRINLIESESHFGGPAHPRNIGLRNAKGKYVAFLDADDLWYECKLAKQVDFLEKNSDVFLVYSQFFNRNNNNELKLMPPKSSLRSGKIFDSLFLSVNYISCSSVMLRNHKEKEYYFEEDKQLIAIEDFDLWLRIAKNEIISYLAEPLVVYCIREKGISWGSKERFQRSLLLTKKWANCVSKKAIFIRQLKLYSRYFLDAF